MKSTKYLLLTALLAGLTTGVMRGQGTEGESKSPKTAKAYPLDRCIVTDEKFADSDMKPHEFVHQGQTIKLCCKSCLKDFNKEPAKYIKKLETAAKGKK